MEKKDLSYAYAEILEVLQYTDKKLVAKIPQSMLDMFRQKRDRAYMKHLNGTKPLSEQKLEKDTYALLALLYRDYWCETEQDKAQLESVLEKNEQKQQAYDSAVDKAKKALNEKPQAAAPAVSEEDRRTLDAVRSALNEKPEAAAKADDGAERRALEAARKALAAL